MHASKNWCDGERVKKLGILRQSKQGLKLSCTLYLNKMRSLQLCENSTWFCWWYYSQCRCLLWHLDILFIFCHYLSTAFVCEIISKIYNKIVLAHLCYKIYRNALVTWFAVSFLAALNFIPSVKVNMLSFLAPKNIISIHFFFIFPLLSV